MSEAESKFRDVISNAIVTLQENVSRPIHGEYVDAIVGSLKLDNWFCFQDKIYKVRWAESYDFDDDYCKWYLYTQGLDGFLSEENDE